MSMLKKYGKSIMKKAEKAVRKRYQTKTGGLRINQVAKDVAYLKGLINTEKKTFSQTGTNQAVGQVNGNSSGHYLLDLTPVIAQGTGYQNRIGNSVKWTSGHLQFLFQTQSGATKPIQVEMYLIKIVGQPFVTASDIMGRFIANNPFVNDQTIYDTASARETDYFKNFRVIRKQKLKFDPSFSGERVTKSVNFGFKLKEHHIKWSADTATVSEGQIMLLMIADNGNTSSSTANTSASNGVITSAVSTGINFQYNHTQYFIDN